MTLLLGYPSRTEGSERTKPRPACEGRPEDWDLDSIYNKPDMIWAALGECDICPIRGLCDRLTNEFVERGLRPRNQVQAGLVWPGQYGATLDAELRAQLRRRGRLASVRKRGSA